MNREKYGDRPHHEVRPPFTCNKCRKGIHPECNSLNCVCCGEVMAVK